MTLEHFSESPTQTQMMTVLRTKGRQTGHPIALPVLMCQVCHIACQSSLIEFYTIISSSKCARGKKESGKAATKKKILTSSRHPDTKIIRELQGYLRQFLNIPLTSFA